MQWHSKCRNFCFVGISEFSYNISTYCLAFSCLSETDHQVRLVLVSLVWVEIKLKHFVIAFSSLEDCFWSHVRCGFKNKNYWTFFRCILSCSIIRLNNNTIETITKKRLLDIHSRRLFPTIKININTEKSIFCNKFFFVYQTTLNLLSMLWLKYKCVYYIIKK